MRTGRGLAWVAGSYLAGTFPSAYVVAMAVHADGVFDAASELASEGDAHILLVANSGAGPGAAAILGDLAKGALVGLAAQRAGLSPGWRAASGVAVVAGHSFPFYARPFAARGITAAAGVSLVLVPGPMVVGGAVLGAGKLLGHTGPASTIGFATVPLIAALRREPPAMVAMSAGILAVILARRLVGIGPVAERDGWPRALFRRLLFDADRPRELNG